LPLQNGVDGIDILMRAVGREHTAGGTCYVSALISEPGVIRHTAMDHLLFGELDGSRSARLERLLEACSRTNFQTTLSSDITVDIWTKFTRLSVLSGMTAVTRSPVGVIVNDPDLFEMLKAAVAEAVAVARAKGVAVRADMVDDTARAYQALPYATKASMLVDLENGRRLELPWLSGAVARIGREVGVATPIHSFIAAVLSPFVNGAQQKSS
jgi:2-dehydropantoate 2-reductase